MPHAIETIHCLSAVNANAGISVGFQVTHKPGHPPVVFLHLLPTYNHSSPWPSVKINTYPSQPLFLLHNLSGQQSKITGYRPMASCKSVIPACHQQMLTQRDICMLTTLSSTRQENPPGHSPSQAAQFLCSLGGCPSRPQPSLSLSVVVQACMLDRWMQLFSATISSTSQLGPMAPRCWLGDIHT